MKWYSIALTSIVVAWSSEALAYPTSVVFAPTAESKDLGGIGGFAYGAAPVSPAPSSFTVAPWFALQAGILPKAKLGSGYTFGGAELGLDAFGPGDGTYKPVLNGKLSLYKQAGWVPSVGVGFMQFAPGALDKSLNLGYVALTEAVTVGKNDFSIGTFTLGYAHSFAQRTAAGAEPIFHGTPPFSFGARGGLVLGYTSPSIGPVSFAVDHVGGYSEVSTTNLAVFVNPVSWAYIGAGYAFANDRSATYRVDSAFAMVGFDVDIKTLLPQPTTAASRTAPPGGQ